MSTKSTQALFAADPFLASRLTPRGLLIYRQTGFITASLELQASLQDLIFRVAPTQASVLITGETGTGKELIARAVHLNSPRGGAPYVAINSALLTDTGEAEIFGIKGGVFTGAAKDQPGYLHAAEGGTVFFDEVGDLEPTFQAKLLRLVGERVFRRKGSPVEERADVRIVSATRLDLACPSLYQEGRLRLDLVRRLEDYWVHIPPLRERPEDLELLVDHRIDRAGRALKRALTLSDGARRVLLSHPWLGNVRELRQVISRIGWLVQGEHIDEALARRCLRSVADSDDARRREILAEASPRPTPPSAKPAAPAVPEGRDVPDGGATASFEAALPLRLARSLQILRDHGFEPTSAEADPRASLRRNALDVHLRGLLALALVAHQSDPTTAADALIGHRRITPCRKRLLKRMRALLLKLRSEVPGGAAQPPPAVVARWARVFGSDVAPHLIKLWERVSAGISGSEPTSNSEPPGGSLDAPSHQPAGGAVEPPAGAAAADLRPSPQALSPHQVGPADAPHGRPKAGTGDERGTPYGTTTSSSEHRFGVPTGSDRP